MTNEPTAARAASTLRNFSIWGPPIESSAARARNASQGHFTAVARTTPGKRDFDKHLFDSYKHGSSSSGAWQHCAARVWARICVFKMSRIGGAIRDTMSIENDAPRVNVWERGRPSFLVLLNARDPTPGHSYLRLLRRKCLLPSAPSVRLRTLNRTSYESRNAMTDESASDGGGCPCCPKRTGQTPARSLPRKENGKARTSMDEKSVRKSHGHHIPPAKGMGE